MKPKRKKRKKAKTFKATLLFGIPPKGAIVIV